MREEIRMMGKPEGMLVQQKKAVQMCEISVYTDIKDS